MAKYIDADKLLPKIKYREKAYGISPANMFSKLVKEMPAADVQEVKHGHWIAKIRGLYHGIDLLDDKNFKGLDMYSCSECEEKVIFKENYCPNCGAKMDAGEGKSSESCSFR